MGQEISVSYQAIKSKVYKLIDALVEGSKTPAEVRESMRRWWNMIHPADRVVAQKYLQLVLQRSNASLAAMSEGLLSFDEWSGQGPAPVQPAKLHSEPGRHQISGHA